MARILIAGCGDVGGALARRLQQAGHHVWGLRRDVASLPPGIPGVAADLEDPGTLGRLPDALDWVFYTAAADARTEDRYQAAYVVGITHLLAALTRAGQRPRRVLLTSSTSVHGQDDGEWVDEDSPAEAPGFGPRALREGEARLLDGPYPATVVRFAGIYGPGRGRLLDALRSGEASCVDSPPAYTNRIHRDDCAAVLHHLMRLPAAAPVYLGVDDCPAPRCEVMDWLAGRMDLPAPARRPGHGGGKRCSNARLRATGYRFLYPSYREGYAALLEAGR